MARPVIVSLWLTLACCALARAADVETLQDFLDIPQRLQDVKGIELLLASQSDPVVGPTNAARVRESFWPLHGMRVWTDWAEVKAASQAITVKAPPNKVLTITYQPKPAAADEPAKQDPAIP